MTATDTNTDDAEKITERRADDYGSRISRLRGVDAATMSVQMPNHYAAESVSVSGYAYDDEPGEVQLIIGGGGVDAVEVGVWIDTDDARALAEQISLAADEADAEIGE